MLISCNIGVFEIIKKICRYLMALRLKLFQAARKVLCILIEQAFKNLEAWTVTNNCRIFGHTTYILFF